MARGYADLVLPFLKYAILAVESEEQLCAVRRLRWRVRLYCTVALCYEDVGRLNAAAKCVGAGLAKVAELRALESLDPPVPAKVEAMLDGCEQDLRSMKYKYALRPH